MYTTILFVLFLYLKNNYVTCKHIDAEKDDNDKIYSDLTELMTSDMRFSNIPNEYFWLYTRKSSSPQFLHTGNIEELQKSDMDLSKNTWILIHGWLGNGYAPNLQIVKNAHLSRWDVNLVILNWSNLAVKGYHSARASIVQVAAEGCGFINFLISNGYSLDKIHLVGHSLGAHMAGLIGKCIGQGKLPSITGLDPAKPQFSIDKPDDRLSYLDAKYVEVIHTNAGLAGFLLPIGNVDIYVNGGTQQPACSSFQLFGCPHVYAYKIYAESILNQGALVATKCSGLHEAKYGNCVSDIKIAVGGELPKQWIDGIYSFYTNTH